MPADWVPAVGVAALLIVAILIGLWRSRRAPPSSPLDGVFRTLDGAHVLRWPRINLPVQILADAGVTGIWRYFFQIAAARINAAAGTCLVDPVLHVLRSPFPADDEVIPVGFVLVRVDSGGAPLGDSNRAGRADVRWAEASGLIFSAVVTVPGNADCKLDIALHELGHVLGLDHQDCPESMMHAVLATRAVIGRPSAEDAGRLRALYRRRPRV